VPTIRKILELALYALLLTALALVGSPLMAAQQTVFTPSGGGGIPPWQFGLILITPSLVAVLLTIVWMRYQRVFAREEGKSFTKRQLFRRSLAWGAIFGAASQAGLQGAINYLTGMPIMWELVGMAILVTGIASMVGYEVIRWYFARKIKSGNKDYIPAYNWLSAKPEQRDLDTGDDIGHLTQYMREDTTEPRDR